MKKTILLLVCAVMVLLSGCALISGGSDDPLKGIDPFELTAQEMDTGDLPVATITLKDDTQIHMLLYPESAPNTVNNFIYLANHGMYDGTAFHSVQNSFLIQGGDTSGNVGSKAVDYYIKGEFSDNGFRKNKLSHTAGAVAMVVDSGNRDSATSQFFILLADGYEKQFDGKYAAFGYIFGSDSLDVCVNISQLELEENSDATPADPPVIKKIRVDTKGVEYPMPEIIE